MMKKKRPAYEIFIVAVCVVLSVLISGALYAGRLKIQKGQLLQTELGSFRRAIMAYRLEHRANPPSLDALTERADGGEGAPYIGVLPGFKEGRAIDPFGNPYVYEPESGWVSSSSVGFERW